MSSRHARDRFGSDAFHSVFGAAVRVARDNLGITQSELAERVGLTRTSITNIELGRQRPLLYQAFVLAQALSISFDALVEKCTQQARQDEIERLEQRLRELKETETERP